MPWSKMLFPLLFLALGAACLWAAWVFRRFAKKWETTYTVKAWAQVVQVLASAASAVLCLGAFLCFVGALVQLVQNWNLYF